MDKTQHAIPEKTCLSCKFCDTIVSMKLGAATQVCRMRAPTGGGQLVGVTPDGQPSWAYTTFWPIVTSTDWCGDYARKLQS